MCHDSYVVRDCVSLFVRPGKNRYILRCLFQSSRRVISFSVNWASLRCLKMMDGSHGLTEIAAHCQVSARDLDQFVAYLVRERIIEKTTNLHEGVNDRYRRQFNFFASFETGRTKRQQYQDKLKNANVALLGLGGIGTWVLETLVRSGIGAFILIDPDTVELHNLPRQALYKEADIGRAKVCVSAECMRAINSGVKITSIRRKITSIKNLAPLVQRAQLVINCADQPDISVINRIVSRACVPLRIPHILCGGYDGHLSFLGPTVIPYCSACWECYITSGMYEKTLRGFRHLPITKAAIEGGTISAIAAITANLHALEAIKILTAYARPRMLNAKAEIDFTTLSIVRTRIRRQILCPVCGERKKRRKV